MEREFLDALRAAAAAKLLPVDLRELPRDVADDAVRGGRFVDAFGGDRQVLLVTTRAVHSLGPAPGRTKVVWTTQRADIAEVQMERRIARGLVHDAVRICTWSGLDRLFTVGLHPVGDDYALESAEATAGAIYDLLDDPADVAT